MTRLVLLLLIPLVACFNLSPSPNIIIKKPQLSTFLPQTRSSYFGYSINLRRNSVLIGAPRAQSTLETQRKVEETGAVFKCNFNSDNDQPCHPYHFDTNGNTRIENTESDYNSEKKDFQMLGASMDGHDSEFDRFVVCAPKLKADVEEADHYLLHGTCYWVSETNTTQPSGVRQINPLRQRKLQTLQGDVKDQFHYYYIYGESGFSVHATDDNEEIIIGCPGIFNWRGSIIRYRAREMPNLGGLSRRDLSLNHAIRKRQVFEYRSEIPNPFFVDMLDDSYFGYAVSSGNFMGPTVPRLFYVATAPQANKQTGEAFIFDIEDYRFEKKIKVFNKFAGSQMGEYFGYTVLAEDFNNDGFPDLAVSAPFYSKNGENETGAVYIFINEGNMAFKKQPIILSEYEMSGRFGIALSKIGDINLDGFNDIAISAPFEGNGVVYIHLGGPDGVSAKPSQRIEAPSELPSPYEDVKSSMFGHGISRGVDIDSNGYRDIAIGSPNSESVYIYKSYPVVNVVASIVPSKTELSLEDTRFNMQVCAYIDSRMTSDKNIEFIVTISLDMKYNRASFSAREIQKTHQYKVELTSRNECSDFVVHVRGTLNDIFKPINIEVKYDTVEKIPETSSEFCESCVALDPRDSKSVSKAVTFITGCSGERCVSDLAVVGTLLNVRQPYVLGSTPTIAIQYDISNAGESAYLTQLKISIPTNVTQFSRVPPSCREENNKRDMVCDINAGKPVANGESVKLDINLEASRLEGESFRVFAVVSSTGDENRPSDNEYENEIFLTEFSDVELIGHSSTPQLSIEDGLRVENVHYTYKIFNNGPSTIKELNVAIQIPMVYIPKPNYHVPIVDFNQIGIKGFYVNKLYEVTWSRDNKVVLQSIDGSTENMIAVDNMNMHSDFDTSKLGYDYEFNSGRQEDPQLGHSNHRRRRSLRDNDEDENIFRVYNQFTGSIDEYHSSYSIATDKEDQTLKNLPRNRTIYFDCSTSELTDECIEAQFTIHNFRPGSEPISINLNFSIDLSRVDEIFNERQNIFLYKTNTVLQRSGDEDMRSLKVTTSNPYTIIFEKLSTSTPIWIWIVSAIVGILVLILLSYALYRLGFFKRSQKEELERLTRESRNITAEEAEELKTLNA